MRLAVPLVCTLLVLAVLGPAATGVASDFASVQSSGEVDGSFQSSGEVDGSLQSSGGVDGSPTSYGQESSVFPTDAQSANLVSERAPEESVVTETETTVVMAVQLEEPGTATWTVSMRVPLETEEETRAFEELGYEYVRGTADVGPSMEPFQAAAEQANEASEREMEIADGVERSLHIENSTGILQLRFQWTSFARQNGNALVVDDAFRTESGTWLPELEENQILVVQPPEGYLIDSAPTGPEVQDATLRWEGPQTFHDEYFYIVYRAEPGSPPVSPTPTPTPTPSPTVTSPPATPPLNGDDGSILLLVAVLLFGGGLAAYYVVDRRRDRDRPIPGATLLESITTNGHEPPEGESPDATSDDDERASADEIDPGPTPEEPFAGTDETLLSDEERVLRLLEANGGRMRQARIVKETDWSNAKVSQLLSAMDEDGEIDKLRIGRENLISLPDVDVEEFQN